MTESLCDETLHSDTLQDTPQDTLQDTLRDTSGSAPTTVT